MQTRVLVGTRKGAWIYTSDESRRSWEISEPIYPGWSVYHMNADTRCDPPRIYAAANHWAWGPTVARSDDGGKTWEQNSPGLAFPEDMGLAVANVWHVEPGHASQPGVVYAGTQPAALFKSLDWGDSWAPVDAITRHPYRPLWGPTGSVGESSLHSIQVDPRDGNRVYAAISSGGTYVSEDAGQTWNLCSHGIVVTHPEAKKVLAEIMESFPQPELPEGVDPAALDEFHKFIIDPKNPDHLWGQAHFGVFRSLDRGKTWSDVTSGLPGFHGFPIAVSRSGADAAYVVPLDHGQNNFRVAPGQFSVWRTQDQGQTWHPLTNGLPGPNDFQSAYREAMDTDALTPGGVYVGTTNGQVFASADAGENWQRLPGTLPPILSVTAAAW